jgi:hypothetical protein
MSNNSQKDLSALPDHILDHILDDLADHTKSRESICTKYQIDNVALSNFLAGMYTETRRLSKVIKDAFSESNHVN